MVGKGRNQIFSEFRSSDLMVEANVMKLCKVTFQEHLTNQADIKYLKEYKLGQQPILNKSKVIRDDINNKIVINHAQMVTRNIVGYFLGTPIQYIQNGDVTVKDEVDMLNRYVSYEDKHSTDIEIGELQSICGTAYRFVYTDGALGDDVPFEEKSLDPLVTYVVYENNIAEKPLAGITFHTLMDENNKTIGVKYYIYTDFGLYEYYTYNSPIYAENISFIPYNIGGIPIIEYPNNRWRIGDWELCMGLMDAISAVQSGRLDDIDQVIQSLLVFVNAEIDEDTFYELREKGIISLTNTKGSTSSVSTVETTLDQTGMNLFSEELEGLLYALLGIPDRNNRSGGGGDTGQAVELRDGWADLEIIARSKEAVFKKSEKQALRIILNILANKQGFMLSLMDVDIKFTRNKSNNLLVKTQGYTTLLATKTISPEDCLTIVDLVSDVAEYISRGKAFWGASFAGLEGSNIALESQKKALEAPVEPVEKKVGEE